MPTTRAETQGQLFYPPALDDKALVGLPRIMESAFRGLDLNPLRDRLMDRLAQDADDANALMDLSSVMFVGWQGALALSLQEQALSVSRRYQLPASGRERLRVLSLMTPGDLMQNIPIEFLLQGSDVTLEMVYLQPDPAEWQLDLPPHDVACIGICESAAARPMLAALSKRLPALPRPTLNDPLRVLDLARDTVWRVLGEAPGCAMPPSASLARAELLRWAHGQATLQELLPGAELPIICRPLGSHAGQGLVRIDSTAALLEHLNQAAGDDFVISPFIDYRSPDGQYRKYRVAFVGGQAFPVHMALSARWMVHYLNGDMLDRPDNRAEEMHFFDAFESDFGRRHAAALAAIDERLGLDYFSIDCGETPDGRLLVFECDTGGVAHAMDPLEDFGYKRPHMLALFQAFRSLLLRAAQGDPCLKPKAGAAPLQ